VVPRPLARSRENRQQEASVSKRFFRLLIVGFMLAAVVSLTGCAKKAATDPSSPPEQPAAEQSTPGEQTEQPAEGTDAGTAEETPQQVTEDPTVKAKAAGIKIQEIKKGDGDEAVAGRNITVDYTGWLEDGTKFDSSKDSGTPFSFDLGTGMVIPGWDLGVAGMKVGGVRKLTIPANQGYGAQGAPPTIPPNATLIFEVELLSVN
jgi:FKBP-type peptidyl-prolyl cis-trans isomerase